MDDRERTPHRQRGFAETRCALAAGAVLGGAGVSCGAPVPPLRAEAPPAVSVEPAADLDRAPPVLRLHVAELELPPEAFLLFEGALGDYHTDRVRDAELPTTLVERRVASHTWIDAEGGAVLAPSVPLAPGGTYAFAALGRGMLATVHVEDDGRPYGARVWPPRGAAAGPRWVFCGDGVALAGAIAAVSLGPSGVAASAAPGADSSGTGGGRCLHLDVPVELTGAVFLPPADLSGIALDPEPLVLSPRPSSGSPAACEAHEVALALGCATVADDRLLVRSADEPLLWSLHAAGAEVVQAAPAGSRFSARGLPPASSVVLAGSVTDLAGTETPFHAAVQTLAAMPHLVLNEVLANPAGPEPAQEWIELYNDGTEVANLAGVTLEDGAGTPVALPPTTLAAGTFALVVSDAFEPAGGTDEPPASGTLLLRIPRLGTAGLSNTGEPFVLRDHEGRVVSRFPGVPAPRAGQSIGRRDPTSLDDDRGAFVPGDPGPTPGWTDGAPRP